MNKANYLSTAPETGGNGRYPLSTQALNFVQTQIEMLQEIARIGGKNYIIRQPTTQLMGVIVIDGEVMPLSGTATGKAIKVYEETTNIQADGETYVAARTIRYARYQSTYTAAVKDLYLASDFPVVSTNDSLNQRIAGLTNLQSQLANRLEIRSGVFTATQINALLDNIRLQCRKGSAVLNGATTYTINVYRTGSTAANGTIESVTQEQILPDLQRFTRQYNPATGTWSNWTLCTDNFHLEVKVVNGTTVWVRHGEVPVGVELVLLRKKKRSKWRRKAARRQGKNQYVHYKGIILSLGTPNKWYVPKCIAVGNTAYNDLIGKELGTMCSELISPANNARLMKVRGTSVKFTDTYTNNRYFGGAKRTAAYAKIALQFAVAGTTYKGSGGEMVKMKYRVWTDHSNGKYTGRRGFSVE